MAMAPPTCVATNSFERKTWLLVRSGGSSEPRYVQKCTVAGSRSARVVDCGKGGYCPTNLCTHSGQAFPLRSVHVVAWVADGAFGIALFWEPREEPVCWQRASVVPNIKLRTARTSAQQNQCFTIAPLAMAYDVSVTACRSKQSRDLLGLEVSKKLLRPSQLLAFQRRKA